MMLKLIATAIFLHILADFVLQGQLGLMKQEDWWFNYPDYKKIYENDWAMAMWLHSFFWTYAVLLPLAWFLDWNIDLAFICDFIANMVIHAAVDHLKANRRTISLVTDQLIHIVQICLTYYLTLRHGIGL